MSGKNARNYTHLYDKSMYTSMWTAYPVYSSAMGSEERPKDWSYSPLIIPKSEYQLNIQKHSYSNGYSRGHMIPNSSRNGIKEMQLQTFYVTNAVPQLQDKFNGTIWKRLEQAIQDLASSDTVYVVTGVAFQQIGEPEKEVKKAKPTDDSRTCPVPNYFYKVVLKVKRDGSKQITSASTVGIWMEHRDYKSNEKYADFDVSVDQIEEWTGFDFFANLPENLQETAEKNNSWSTFAAFK